MTDDLAAIKRHNSRIEEINSEYYAQIATINELMAEAYRERARKSDESWQQYLSEGERFHE